MISVQTTFKNSLAWDTITTVIFVFKIYSSNHITALEKMELVDEVI